MNRLYNGDCIEIMNLLIKEGVKVDAVITDLPYGTSACPWDSVIPFDSIWGGVKQLLKKDGACVLFSQQPFTSRLICSNLEMYKYNWIWEKDNATNFLNKRYQPGKITEDICVFGMMATSYSKNGNMKYNPQLSEGVPYKTTNTIARRSNAVIRQGGNIHNVITDNKGTRLPNNILKFKRDKDKVHPTQKPVALLEYLIKTYTDEGETVLDMTMGSGTCGVACKNTNRDFIGIELDEHYFEIAKGRIENAEKEKLSSLNFPEIKE